jgi:dihydropteroate synthase
MPEFLLQCQGTIHTLSTPWIMGILNSTPDSFYAGSRLNAPEAAADRARTMLNSGARIIDIGGYSSRPGADPVTSEEEWNRLKEVIPAVSQVLQDFPGCFHFCRYLSVLKLPIKR